MKTIQSERDARKRQSILRESGQAREAKEGPEGESRRGPEGAGSAWRRMKRESLILAQDERWRRA